MSSQIRYMTHNNDFHFAEGQTNATLCEEVSFKANKFTSKPKAITQ